MLIRIVQLVIERLFQPDRGDVAVAANRALQGLCASCDDGEPKEHGICDGCYYEGHPGF